MENEAADRPETPSPVRGRVTRENVEDVFTYHAPKDGQPAQYEAIRSKARELAHVILENTPGCADQQAALRLLRESVMTANAAIALEGTV